MRKGWMVIFCLGMSALAFAEPARYFSGRTLPAAAKKMIERGNDFRGELGQYQVQKTQVPAGFKRYGASWSFYKFPVLVRGQKQTAVAAVRNLANGTSKAVLSDSSGNVITVGKQAAGYADGETVSPGPWSWARK